MLRILFVALLSFGSCFGAIDNSASERQKVAARLQEFTDAVNQGNTSALSSFWTQNPEIVTPLNGQTIEGKNAVDQYLQQKVEDLKNRNKKLNFEPKSIEFPDPNSATVDGIVLIYYNGKLIDRQARRLGLEKKNGQWYIDFLSDISVKLPPTIAHEHLKDLEWLLGNWIDEDSNVTIQYSGRWDKYRNFLVQTFEMDIYGVDTLNGMQVIGWDPIDKKIRSWIYDSDGGFGTGTWTKIPNGWSSTVNYTLSSGETASSTNYYTNITDNSYSFSSINRRVGDKNMPNIEPVTVHKE